jgi:DNA repair photolyase
MSKISAYYGEFLISPVPLELSLNYCSHRCSYCFANLNKPDRNASAKEIITQIANSHKNTSYESLLLANKAAVLISNRVDPFAESNYRIALPIIEMLQSNGNPVVFQTKGGKGIDKCLDSLNYKTLWYISISFWDDEKRKKIEPAAPSISERLELVKELKQQGHDVIIGINPLCPDWLPESEFESLLEKLQELNIKNLWISSLHLNSQQIASMPDYDRAKYSQELLNDAKSKNQTRLLDYLELCCLKAKKNNFSVLSITLGMHDPIFQNAHNLLGSSLIPTFSDFKNNLIETYSKTLIESQEEEIKYIAFDFDLLWDYLRHPYFLHESTQHRGYLMVHDRTFVRVGDKKLKLPKTLKGILRIMYEKNKLEKMFGVDKIELNNQIAYLLEIN